MTRILTIKLSENTDGVSTHQSSRKVMIRSCAMSLSLNDWARSAERDFERWRKESHLITSLKEEARALGMRLALRDRRCATQRHVPKKLIEFFDQNMLQLFDFE
jgi:hypothetical protein